MSINYASAAKDICQALSEFRETAVFSKSVDKNELLYSHVIIATSSSNRNGATLCRSVVEVLHKHNHAKVVLEGKNEAIWILIDAGEIIVHIMSPLAREYYCLEKLWE